MDIGDSMGVGEGSQPFGDVISPVRSLLDDIDGEVLPLTCDGFDAALIGTVERCGQPLLACYDVDTMIALLMSRDRMEHDEAVEYLEFNVFGAWCGSGTPVFLRRMTSDDAMAALAGE